MCYHLPYKPGGHKPQIAETDIPVVKFLREHWLDPSTVVSPFQAFAFKLGVEYIAENWESTVDAATEECLNIFEGFHSFPISTEVPNWVYKYTCQRYDCIIPKGSQYFDVGHDDWNVAGLVSEKIKIVGKTNKEPL